MKKTQNTAIVQDIVSLESDFCSYFCIIMFLIQFSPILKKTDQLYDIKNNKNNSK